MSGLNFKRVSCGLEFEYKRLNYEKYENGFAPT